MLLSQNSTQRGSPESINKPTHIVGTCLRVYMREKGEEDIPQSEFPAKLSIDPNLRAYKPLGVLSL